MPEDTQSKQLPSDRDFAAALHEVSNDLTVVLGWLEQAREARIAEERAATESSSAAIDSVLSALGVAISRARRAHRIARRAIGADTARPLTELLGALLRESVLGIEPLARGRRIAVSLDAPRAVAGCPLEGGDKLLQVLTNLLLNAIAVTPEGGSINVSASRASDTSDYVQICVCDGGPGIPTTLRDKIFERGHSGRPGGAGIGLSHAATLAKEEGGRLELHPFAENCGATFELTWPLGPLSSQPGPHTQRAAMLSGVRIAVVEDDRAVVDLLDMVLAARGANCATFASAALLDEAFANGATFDVALLDASPFGTELAATVSALRAAHPELDIVLISGTPNPPTELDGLTWIRKPFEVAEVIAVLALLQRSKEPATASS